MRYIALACDYDGTLAKDGRVSDSTADALRRRDYSRWFHEAIKDDELAADAGKTESDVEAPPAVSRKRLRDAIERRYTLPA